MRVFDKRKPNIKSLTRRGDVDGLIAAIRDPELRTEALVALRDVAPDRAGPVFTEALTDPSDQVRCAAVLGLYAQKASAELARASGSLPPGRARGLAARALLELREPGSSATVARALVHRRTGDPLDDSDTGF